MRVAKAREDQVPQERGGLGGDSARGREDSRGPTGWTAPPHFTMAQRPLTIGSERHTGRKKRKGDGSETPFPENLKFKPNYLRLRLAAAASCCVAVSRRSESQAPGQGVAPKTSSRAPPPRCFAPSSPPGARPLLCRFRAAGDVLVAAPAASSTHGGSWRVLYASGLQSRGGGRGGRT